MYASIRKYKSYQTEETLKKVRETFIPMISEMPGFISYQLIQTEDYFLSLTVFDTKELAVDSNLYAEGWIKENIPTLIEGELESTYGELVAEKKSS